MLFCANAIPKSNREIVKKQISQSQYSIVKQIIPVGEHAAIQQRRYNPNRGTKMTKSKKGTKKYWNMVKSNAKEAENQPSLLQLECETYIVVLYRCQMKKSIQIFLFGTMMEGQKISPPQHTSQP
jgi:hypothetical protein